MLICFEVTESNLFSIFINNIMFKETCVSLGPQESAQPWHRGYDRDEGLREPLHLSSFVWISWNTSNDMIHKELHTLTWRQTPPKKSALRVVSFTWVTANNRSYHEVAFRNSVSAALQKCLKDDMVLSNHLIHRTTVIIIISVVISNHK